MKIEETLQKFKGERPDSLNRLILFFSVEGSDLLFSPSTNVDFNNKHRLECIICSTMLHLWVLNFYYGNNDGIIGGVINELCDLLFMEIEDVDEITELNMFDLPNRFVFYGEEIIKIKNMNDTKKLPWKLISLLYENPLLKNPDDIIIKSEQYNLFEYMPRLITLTTFLKHIKEPLIEIMKNKDTIKYG